MASKFPDPRDAEPTDAPPPVSPKWPGPPKAANEDPPEDDYPKPIGLRTDGEGIKVPS